jgi:hypothetical protein
MGIRREHLQNDCQALARAEISRKNNDYLQETVGVFDTTFDGSSLLQSEDIQAFLEGVLHLLDALSSIAVLFKIKNP